MTSWPFREFTKHAWAGAWVNSLFRREGGPLASDLIRDAVACTRYIYRCRPLPHGMVTFVDASKVRSKRDPGRCYLRAGFKQIGETKGGLLAFGMAPADMPEPHAPVGMQLSLEAA